MSDDDLMKNLPAHSEELLRTLAFNAQTIAENKAYQAQAN